MLASRRIMAGLALAGAFASPARAQRVAEVQVVPEAVTLRVGDRRPILATAFDAAGNVLLVRFQFASSDTGVVGVDATGALLARRPGLARVEARAGGRSGAVTVAVRGVDPAGAPTPGPTGVPAPLRADSAPAHQAAEPPAPTHPRVESLLLEPGPGQGPVAIPEGTGRQLTVLPRDSADADIPGVTVVWESADAGVATVDSTGLVRGAAPGSTTISARVQGFRPVVWEVRVLPREPAPPPGAP